MPCLTSHHLAGQNAAKPSIFGNQPGSQASTFGSFGTQPQQGQQQTQQTGGLFSGGNFLNPQQPQGQQPGQQQQQQPSCEFNNMTFLFP